MNAFADNHSILREVWSMSKGEWVFTPEMRGSSWSEGKAIRKTEYLNGRMNEADLYFTPLSYVRPQRRLGNLGDVGVIFADIDGPVNWGEVLTPSLLVQTSEGHSHGYWFLKEPVPPAKWAAHSKGWTRKIGADPGGWDATQVLRVPHSLNHKYSPPFKVRPVYWNPELRYPIEVFPQAADALISSVDVGSAPLPSKSERDYLIKAGIEDDRLPLGARYWLTASTWEIEALGSIDRSKIQWGVEKNLLAAGYTVYEVFHLVHFSPINKWVGDPSKLWREVNKAAGVQ